MIGIRKLTLIALAWVSLCAAQGYVWLWTWGPAQPLMGPGYTTTNNAHTIFNDGNTVFAAVTAPYRHAELRISYDRGSSWTDRWYVNIEGDSSKNPALAVLDGPTSRLFSVNAEKWYTYGGNAYTKAGAGYFKSDQPPGNSYRDLGAQSSVSGQPSVSGIRNGNSAFAEAVWVDDGDVKSMDGRRVDDGITWEYGKPVKNAPSGWEYVAPSVAIRAVAQDEVSVCVFTAKQNPGTHLMVYYARKMQGDNSWEGKYSLAGDGTYAFYTHPVIALDPVNEYEVVVYQDEVPDGRIKLECQLRSIVWVPESSKFDTTEWAPGDVIESNVQDFMRPNMWFNSGTFYLVYTARDAADGAKRIYFTHSSVTSDENGLHLVWSDPKMISDGLTGADSASIYVDGGTAYVMFNKSDGVNPTNPMFVRGILTPFYRPDPGPPSYGINPGIVPGKQAGTTHIACREDDFISYIILYPEGERVFQSSPDYGESPSLALDANGNATCAYTKDDSVWMATLTSESAWSVRCLYGGSSASKPGHPATSIFQGASGRTVNVAFPVWDSTSANSQVLFCQADSNHLHDVVLDTIDNFSGSRGDSCASLQCGISDSIWVTYGRADSVKHRWLLCSSTDQNRPGAWSSASTVNPLNMQGFYPSCQDFKGRLYVTYLGKPRTALGLDTSVVQRCSRDLSNPNVIWEGYENISDRNTMARGFYPSLSGNEVVTWAESLSGGKWVIRAKVRDSVINLSSVDSVSKFCSVAADSAIANSPSTSDIKIDYVYYTKVAVDTWEARYASKEVKVSNADANVTKYNNGRKLLIENDKLAAVWRTSWNGVDYAERDDDPAAGWTNYSVTLVSSDVPCLDRDYLGNNWVACRAQSSRKIDGAYSTGDPSSWTVQTVYDCGAYNQTHTKAGPPSIAACRSDPNSQNHTACYFAFTTYREDHDSSFVVLLKTNASGAVIDCDTLDRATPRTDSFASISIRAGQGGDFISVAWQRENEIYYTVTTSAIDPASTSAISWSNAYNLSNSQSISRHPQVAACADSLVVAWAEGSTPAVVCKRQSAGSAYNSWGSQTAVSYATDTCCDYPTISLGSGNDSTIIAYHKMVDTLTSDVWVNINFQSNAAHNLNITNSTPPSKYPHVAFEMHDGTTPVIHAVWTEVLTPNYHEMGYRRWDLTQSGGGGEMSADIYDASIEPELASPRPNPFGHSTTISYAVNRAGNTTLKVFDLSGRTVRTLADGSQKPGRYSFTWNRQDDHGRTLPEGVYFVRLKSPNFEKTRKAVITE